MDSIGICSKLIKRMRQAELISGNISFGYCPASNQQTGPQNTAIR